MCKSSTQNQQILLETSFWCDIQQEQWIEWLKSENNGNERWRPSLVLTFRLVKLHKWCRKWALCAMINKKSDITPVSRTIFFLELNFQYGRLWPSWILMFGLVKIQEMIPGNKHILLKTSFSCEIQQVIWVICLKTEKNGIGRWYLIFRLIKIQKWCQKWALYATFSRKSDITRGFLPIYLKVTFSIWPQATILNFDSWTGQNTKTMPEMEYPCQNLLEKWYYTAFDINLFSSYISNMATGGHFGFWLLTNSAAIFARVTGAKFFLNTSKSSNQVSNLTMLSVVPGPPDCTQLIAFQLRVGGVSL